MFKDNLGNFRRILPPDLIAQSISLENIGINEYVWLWQNALKVIDILFKKRIFILGGDVYIKKGDTYKPTGHNWYINRPNLPITDLDLQKTILVSKNFITSYKDKNGEEFYYSIVADFK